MSDPWAQLTAALVGALVTVVWRIIDRYLPDPENRNPRPDRQQEASDDGPD